MPKEETEICDSEQHVDCVERFVESLSNIGKRKDAEIKKDCRRWYTGVLKNISKETCLEERSFEYLVRTRHAVHIELFRYHCLTAGDGIVGTPNEVWQRVE